jgi:hypothetical protein
MPPPAARHLPSASVDLGELPPNPSALPSVRARALAFAAIVVAGAFGALIGWGIARVLCTGACTGPEVLGAVVGAGAAAGGVGVVAVLVLRAMGEWRRIQAAGGAERS